MIVAIAKEKATVQRPYQLSYMYDKRTLIREQLINER